MDYDKLKDLILSLKLKDDLGLDDLILIVDSASPKATDGAIKLIKAKNLLPSVNKKDLEALRKDLEKSLAEFKKPDTIIVDNSDLDERIGQEIQALNARFEGVYELAKNIRELEQRLDDVPKPASYDMQIVSLSTKLSELESAIPEPQPIPVMPNYELQIELMQEAFRASLREVENKFIGLKSELLTLGEMVKSYTENSNGQIKSLSNQIADLANAKQIADRATQQAKVALEKVRKLENVS